MEPKTLEELIALYGNDPKIFTMQARKVGIPQNIIDNTVKTIGSSTATATIPAQTVATPAITPTNIAQTAATTGLGNLANRGINTLPNTTTPIGINNAYNPTGGFMGLTSNLGRGETYLDPKTNIMSTGGLLGDTQTFGSFQDYQNTMGANATEKGYNKAFENFQTGQANDQANILGNVGMGVSGFNVGLSAYKAYSDEMAQREDRALRNGLLAQAKAQQAAMNSRVA